MLGAIPGLPKVHLHNPVLAYESGDDFLKFWYLAEEGKLDPFVLVVEGSIPNEKIKDKMATGPPSAPTRPPASRSRPPNGSIAWRQKALAVVGIGTCATYGGIHAMEGNPTGCMGLADYLGWDWRSKAGLPIVNVPGCPVQPDNFMETVLYLLYQVAGLAPMIPLDDQLRPNWLFGKTVHEGCDRAGYYEQGDFANEYGSPKCIVKLGCWGPVVNCNVPKRGWMAGIGGCPNVGGICIGCTMPGFPDKFMPFMDEPPGAQVLDRGDRRLRPRDQRAALDHATTPSTRNRSGGIRGRSSPPAITHGLTDSPSSKEDATMSTVTTATRETQPEQAGTAGRDELGPDHAHRRQPRHLHQDRFRQPRGRRVPQHLVDLPRLQHLHEGQGSARRALHHQPHLRHLRRQPRHLRRPTRRTWRSASSRRRWANGSSTSAKPPSTCSTTTSSRTTWSASTSASRW